MKHPTVALAVMLALAGGSIATASAQQYGYPNQYGYPQQEQQQHRHHHHRRDGGNYQGGNYQQCGNAYGDQNRYGYGNDRYGNNGYGNNSGRYGNNGACQTIRGTITAVNGNQVTLRVGDQGYGNYGNSGRYGGYGSRGQNQITIDDQPALNNQTSGRVAVGRFVTATGYWSNGVFYATTMN